MNPFFKILAAAAIAPACAASVNAEDIRPKAVVELFTSQGCNSCPPADAALEQLAGEGDTLALAYHVDYWNYLGWADTLGSHENTERQYGYAHAMQRGNVYTPQAVINGRVEMNGSRLRTIKSTASSLEKSGQGLRVPVRATLNGKEIDIFVGDGEGKADIVVAYYKQKQAVKITRGENAGKTITYWNSVTKLSTVGMWDGKATTLKLPMSVLEGKEYDGCAILLQAQGGSGKPGPILGATAFAHSG